MEKDLLKTFRELEDKLTNLIELSDNTLLQNTFLQWGAARYKLNNGKMDTLVALFEEFIEGQIK